MKFIIASIVTLSILSGLFISCGDNAIDIIKNETGSRVNTTIFGTVVKEDGMPVSGAQVTVEGQVKTSGSNGQFIFENVSVPSDRLYIKSSFTGYFNASTSARPNADASTIVQIRMMEKDNIQTISGAAGGTVSLSNGSSVQIQPNSLELTNGTAYTGTVNVAIEYLDPTSQLFPLVLPGGDLSAKRSDSSGAVLFSYGMLVVELTGSANELLRIKSGQNSTLTTSIPASMVSGAPATIPLWFFDEAAGIWREDGSATKQGSSYVGNVNHFSFWNYDIPGNIATLKGRIIDCNGSPIPLVGIETGQVNSRSNSEGLYQSIVPSGIDFYVKISPGLNYGLYSSQSVRVGPFITGQIFDMGDLQIDCPANTASIKGRVVCSGQSQNAFIFIRNAYEQHTAVTNDGYFNIIGKPNTMYSLTIYRLNGVSFSTGVTTTAAGSFTDIGDITLCNTPAVIGDNGYIIDGDGFNHDVVGFITPYNSGDYDKSSNTSGIYVQDIFDSTSFFQMSFSGNQLGSHPLAYVYIRLLGNDYMLDTQNPQGEIIVSEFGPVGGYMTGTFTCTLHKNSTATTVDITSGKFRVLREF